MKIRFPKNKRNFLKINFALISALTFGFSLAKSEYNVLKNPGFEEIDTTYAWKFYSTLGAFAHSHYRENTPEGLYVGMTLALGREKIKKPFAELRQKFVPRIIKDFLPTSALRFFAKYNKILGKDIYKFGVTLKSVKGNELEYCLNEELPTDENSWATYSISFVDKWKSLGFPENDSLNEIILWSRGKYEKKDFGQQVEWDYIQLLSSRFDNDAKVLSIDSPLEISLNQPYIPKATIKNVGALDINGIGASCKIIRHSMNSIDTIYDDAKVCYCLLNPDSTIQFEFKKFTLKEKANYFVITVFSLFKDQNPSNDSLSREIKLGIETEEKKESKLIKVEPSVFSNQAIISFPKGKK